MHDPILNLIASCLGAALGCFTAEFYLIPRWNNSIIDLHLPKDEQP